jgi:regulator of extracellular matrix RemA (YlzA/DUF370 family)
MKNYKLSTVLAVSLTVASTGLAADAGIEGILPNAQPGECYAKVIIPAKFETTTEKILSKEASETLQIIPAKYGTGTEKVLVKEASTRLSVIPATYKNTTEKVLVRDEEVKWQTGLKNSIPVSAEILAAAKTGGADIDGMAVGSCYREYFTPAQYKTDTQTYISKEASESLKIVPATYEYAEEKILVKEASQRIVKVPATYGTASEKILVEPEKTMWKKSQCNGRNNDCGVMCLVSTPARYKTVTKRVVKTPATTKVIDIPAVYKTIKVRKLATPASVQRVAIPEQTATYSVRSKVADATFSWAKVGTKATGKYTGHQVCKLATPAQYKTITKTVVDQPATTKEVEIPAVYSNVTVTKLVTPAEVKRIAIPEAYSNITKRNMVSPSSVVWKKVVCQSSMGTSTLRQVQTSLQAKGLYNGPIDGIFGTLTKQAVKAYQKQNGLAVGGLTHEVMKSLGVNF